MSTLNPHPVHRVDKDEGLLTHETQLEERHGDQQLVLGGAVEGEVLNLGSSA